GPVDGQVAGRDRADVRGLEGRPLLPHHPGRPKGRAGGEQVSDRPHDAARAKSMNPRSTSVLKSFTRSLSPTSRPFRPPVSIPSTAGLAPRPPGPWAGPPRRARANAPAVGAGGAGAPRLLAPLPPPLRGRVLRGGAVGGRCGRVGEGVGGWPPRRGGLDEPLC